MPPQNQNTTSVSAAPPPTLKDRVTSVFHRAVNPDVPARPTSGTPGNYSLRDEWNKLPQEEQDKQFSSLSDDEKTKFATDMGWFGSATGISAQPKVGSIPWMKETALTYLNKGLNWLPTVGGVGGSYVGGAVGGMVGGGVAPEGGEVPGVQAGRYAGSAIGGGLGEAVRQGIEHLEGYDKYEDPETKTWDARSKKIKHQVEGQFAGELTGHYIGKWMRPTMERSIAKFYNAAKLDYGDPEGKGNLETVIDDVMKTEKVSAASGKPAVTIGDFYNNLKSLQTDIGEQVDSKMSLPVRQGKTVVPLRKATPNPIPLVDLIKSLGTKDEEGLSFRATLAGSDPSITDAKKYQQMLKDRALTFQQPGWTYGRLAAERMRINRELNQYYGMTRGEKADYLNSHPLFEVDKAIAKYIRDITYPEMDRLSGQPLGATAELQEKYGKLNELEEQTLKNMGVVKTSSRQAKGASPLEKMNVSTYGSGGHVGASAHRLQAIVHTPSDERAANKKVAQAFGHGFGVNTRRVVTTPFGSKTAGDTIWSMPLRYLTRPTATTKPEDNDSDGPQSSVAPTSTPKELMEKAKRLAPAGQGQVAYNHLAVNPATGHKIASRDGKTWEDAETGQQVA
jgi:hypothetical protein